MVRLGASLERIPPAHKAEVCDWLLQPLTGGGIQGNPQMPRAVEE